MKLTYLVQSNFNTLVSEATDKLTEHLQTIYLDIDITDRKQVKEFYIYATNRIHKLITEIYKAGKIKQQFIGAIESSDKVKDDYIINLTENDYKKIDLLKIEAMNNIKEFLNKSKRKAK